MSSRRLITALYVLLFAGFGVGAGALFLDARAEYVQLKRAEAASKQRLVEVQAQLELQKKILERLRRDPDYVERKMRQRGYVQPSDMIFRFEN